MVAEGYATTEEAAVANLEPMPSIKPSADLRPQSAWVEEVQDQLIRDDRYSVLGQTPKDREQRLLTGGLTIEATIVPGLQAAAQNAMNDILPEKPGFTGALVSIDPTTGAVRAMVAGPGFEESQYNIATSPPGRQAGSTWKVITLAAALTAGFSPQDQVNGTSPCEFPFLIGRTENFEPGGGVLTLRARHDRIRELRVRPYRARGRIHSDHRPRAQDGDPAVNAPACVDAHPRLD